MKNLIKKILKEDIYHIFEADENFDPLGHIGGKEQTDLSEPEEMGVDPTKDCVLNFSNGNMKLQWPYFSLPAGYTCPFAKQCKTLPAKWKGTAKQGKFEKPASWEKNYQLAKGAKYLCYAGRAQAQYPGANIQAFSNLKLLNKFKTSEEMANLIIKSLRFHGLQNTDLFRIHEAGDFFSQAYFDAWLEVARKMSGTLFYAYTVSLPYWLNRKGQIPRNFKLIASMDEDNEELINAEGLRYAKVVGSTEEARELGLRMDVDDMLAWGTDDSFALPLHGSQPKGSEAAEIRKKQTKKDETGKSFDEKLKDAKQRNQSYKDTLRAQVKSQIRGELPLDVPPFEGEFEIEESYYGPNTNLLIENEENLDWVKDVDPIEFIKTTFKDGDTEHGKLLNGSYSVSVNIPEETEYTWDEEQAITKELQNRIGVYCSFGLARGSDDEHLMAIDVDDEEDLEKVLKWIKSSDKTIKEYNQLDWVDSLVKEKPSVESLIGYLNSFLVDTHYRFSIVDTDFVHILGPSSVSDKDGDTEYLDMWVEDFNLKSVEKELRYTIKVFKKESNDYDGALLDFRNCVLILNKLEPAFKTKKKPIKETQEFGSEDVLLQGHKGYHGKVFVHRNLNKPPYWTIKARNGEDAGLVIGYDKSVHLKNVVFVVGEKSRQRVLASRQKNVHAGVVGNIVDGGMDTNGWIPVTYNPYTNRTFVRIDNGEPIFKAKEAILKNEKEVYVKL
jgi:hypothetical protein